MTFHTPELMRHRRGEGNDATAVADERKEIAMRFLGRGLLALFVLVATIFVPLILPSVLGAETLPFSPALTAIALAVTTVCFAVAAHHYAESKGYHGMVGVGCLLLGPVGLVILLNLRDRIGTMSEG